MNHAEHDINLAPGQILSNRYEIVRFLGKGGMASVYLACDTLLGGTKVALKVLHVHLQHQSAQYQRFLREVQLTRLVTHPNVVRTYDVGRDGEMTYYTMEIISGVSLDKIIAQHGCLPTDRALRFILQLCAGLRAIHRCEIVHRDLKPANILIIDKDQIKITDFGVARPKISHLTEDNSFCGTVLYIAPEVFRLEPITPATDCYSLGVTFYEMLTGRVPLRDEIIGKLIGMVLAQTPDEPREYRSDLPDWLNELIMKMLSKKPAERPSLDEIMYIVGSRAEGVIGPLGEADSFLTPPAPGTEDLRAPTDPRSMLDRTTAESFRPPVDTVSYRPRLVPIKSRLRLVKYLVLAAFAVSVGLTHLILYQSSLGEWLEQAALDVWFPIRGRIAPPSDVVLISMDEQSYSNLKVPITDPWPRALHAQLLQRLREYGVKRVVFDILFMNAGPDPTADQALADAIAEIPTVLGSSFMATRRTTINGSFLLEEYLQPHDPFRQKAAAVGIVGLPNDFGRVRRFNTEQSERYHKLISLAAAGAGAYSETIELPTPNDFINYYGPPGAVQTISYEMMLESEEPLPPELLKDKVVVIGLTLNSSSGPMQKEAFPSPFRGSYTFGAEIHATAIGNILHKDWIRRAPPRKEAAVLSLLAFLLAFFIFVTPSLWGRLLCLGAAVAWSAAAYTCFCYGLFLPGALLVGVVLPITVTLTALHRQINAGGED